MSIQMLHVESDTNTDECPRQKQKYTKYCHPDREPERNLVWLGSLLHICFGLFVINMDFYSDKAYK